MQDKMSSCAQHSSGPTRSKRITTIHYILTSILCIYKKHAERRPMPSIQCTSAHIHTHTHVHFLVCIPIAQHTKPKRRQFMRLTTTDFIKPKISCSCGSSLAGRMAEYPPRAYSIPPQHIHTT